MQRGYQCIDPGGGSQPGPAEVASEQAAALEQTSASLEEMASMTKRNAESAQAAKVLVGEARQAADTGVVDVENMTAAMDAVKTSSEQITKSSRRSMKSLFKRTFWR